MIMLFHACTVCVCVAKFPHWKRARALGCCLYDSAGRMDTCGRWLMIARSV